MEIMPNTLEPVLSRCQNWHYHCLEKYNDIDRIAEGLREFLQEFPEFSYFQKHEALKIVTKNFEDSLK
jgi:hypothetical protein